jgi:hypothetical protein
MVSVPGLTGTPVQGRVGSGDQVLGDDVLSDGVLGDGVLADACGPDAEW